MTKIIGREKEMQTLDESMKSGRSEFVAVYGRRHFGGGKTLMNLIYGDTYQV
ncbi:MAG: hypothetical protein ACI4T5_00510 [Prevotella sp.]